MTTQNLGNLGDRISGVAELMEVTSRTVVFRYSIDETYPETIVMSITRERWEDLNWPTHFVLTASIHEIENG